MIDSARDGVHGGSNVITISAEPTLGTLAAALATPSFRKRTAGHPGVVAVMMRDVVDEAEIDDVVAKLGIDQDAQCFLDAVDEFAGHDGALTVSS